MSEVDPFDPVLGLLRGSTREDPPTLEAPTPISEAAGYILFHYLYRDADNYKVGQDYLFMGSLQSDDLDIIRQKLYEGDGFIPSQVGLDDLQPQLQAFDIEEHGFDNPDHPWHELNVSEDIKEIKKSEFSATMVGPITWRELVENFRHVTWDPDEAGLPI